MKPVILAEKPSQAKAYADAFSVRKQDGFMEIHPCPTFPEGAYITWGVGHLVELKEPHTYNPSWKRWSLATLPILPDRYEFQVAQGKFKQFQVVKKLIKGTDTVINACDVDREGSNIFYSIYYQTGAKGQTIQRLWINSLEVDEVLKGFANLRDNRKDLLLYEEAKSRQISDWLVGMNGSRLYTLLLKAKGFDEVFPIGRVQSPTVYLIYQRQMEIENFVSEPFYEIEATFTSEHGSYKGKAKAKEPKREIIRALLADHDILPNSPGIVTSVAAKEKRTAPPQLHSLSTLQANANKLWKTSPANVLKLMQGLYEKKLVTYPRTDSRHITPNEFAYLAAQVSDYQKVINHPFPVASLTPKKRYVDSAKVQEHYAIIPTKKIPSDAVLNRLTPLERNLYEEVVRTTLAMFHTDYLYTETKITTEVNKLKFFTTGKTERDKGWKALFVRAQSDKDKDKDKEEATLPPLHENESVESAIGIKEGKTQPPKPYTEGQLIAMMKTCGKLVDDKNETDILKEIEGLGTEATRSGIIETIKRHGYISVTKNIVAITDKGRVLCQAIEGNLLSSPSMTAKWETYLRKIGNGEGTQDRFLGSIGRFLQKLLQEVPDQLKKQKIDIKLPPSAKRKYGPPQEVAPCPACKQGTIVVRNEFYGCSNYNNGCKMTIPGIFLKKKVTVPQVKLLCTQGKTNTIKGFTAQNGSKFDAMLALENGKVKVELIPEQQIPSEQ